MSLLLPPGAVIDVCSILHSPQYGSIFWLKEVEMNLKDSVKPISYVKTHASELVREVAETGITYVITQNGQAKAVLQDVKSYDETMESLALLKILAVSTKSIESGNYKPLHQAFSDLDERKKQMQ